MSKALVPGNLKFSQLVNRHPSTIRSELLKNGCYYVCHIIIQQMRHLDDQTLCHKSKKTPYFVPLQSTHLRKCLGSRIYKGVIDWMILAKIIEKDHSWEAKKTSQGYRLTDHYLGSNYRWVSLCTTISQKITLAYDKKEKSEFWDTVENLMYWFNPSCLQIDGDAARKQVDAMFNDEVIRARTLKTPEERHKCIFRAKIQADKNRNAIYDLENGNYSFSQDNFGYRFHTPLTRLSKKLRKYISCHGEELIQLDLSGSQLYFANYLLGFKIDKITENQFTINKQLNNNTIMFPLNKKKVLKSDQKERVTTELYYDLSTKGRIYEHLVEHLDTKQYFSERKTYTSKRKFVKKTLLAMLFGNPSAPEHRRLYNQKNMVLQQTFQELFPQVSEVFNGIKKQNSKLLCQMLQRIESVAMLKNVCGELQRRCPYIPIYTIHDCLIMPKRYEEIAEKIMRKELSKLIGIAPKIDRTSWQDVA